jgi:hypothetical protein
MIEEVIIGWLAGRSRPLPLQACSGGAKNWERGEGIDRASEHMCCGCGMCGRREHDLGSVWKGFVSGRSRSRSRRSWIL